MVFVVLDRQYLFVAPSSFFAVECGTNKVDFLNVRINYGRLYSIDDSVCLARNLTRISVGGGVCPEQG